MSYGIVHHFPGGTQDQYEATLAAVHPADGSPPAGQLFHAAGSSEDGWTIFAIHDSRASWEHFRDTVLGPAMAVGVAGGFTTVPQETCFEIVNEVRTGASTGRAGEA